MQHTESVICFSENLKKTLSELNHQKLPILSSQELIQLLGLTNKIRSIERLTSVGSEYFKELYLPAITQYLESVQLAPASTAHHHAGPGGLATHTLDVIERALRQRKSFELPLNAGPETIFDQEHYWTYAVFIGSLLHDIGKMTTNTLIVLNNGKVWNPHKSSLLVSGAKSYHIRFDKHPYKYHTQIANSFFHMIPEKGRGWLSDIPPIFTELCAWLYGDYYEFGMIGQIIRYADGQSVAANLKIGGGERVRFNNAPEIPLIEKMMTALREMLESGELKINGAEGSSGWTEGHFTYLVCGTVADKVRSYLHKMGSSDIPGDNTRLFDTWQEHGYAISNPSDAAIWLIKINDRLKLTVLKFETNRLFHPSKQPGVFQGQISVIDNNKNIEPTPELDMLSKTDSNPENRVTEPVIESNQTLKPESDKESTEPETQCDDPFTDTVLSETETSRTAANPEPVDGKNHHVKDFYMAGNEEKKELEQIVANSQISASVYQKPSKLPAIIKLEDPDIAKHFITWLQEGLQERKIQVNNSKSLIHIAKEGALIVTPIAFKKFIWEFKLSPEGTNINKVMARIQDRLKANMEKKKQHRRTKSGINIHTYQINGDSKISKIKCWLLPTKTVFGEVKPPVINPVLENSSGFEEVHK